MFYKLFMPKQAVGANLVYFDLFNTTASGYRMDVEHVFPIVSGAVAVTGAVAVDLHLTRTSAIGTGGTAATTEGTDPTAATITHVNGSQPITGLVTARLTPTGGATAGAWLAWTCVFSEETNAGTYTPTRELVRQGNMHAPPVKVLPGAGIRVVQGAVASVGNIGFDIAFRLVPLA